EALGQPAMRVVLGPPAVGGQDLHRSLHVIGPEEEVQVLRVPVDAGVVGVGVGAAHQERHAGLLQDLDGPGSGLELVPLAHPLRGRGLGGELTGMVGVPRLSHARPKVGRRPRLDTPPGDPLRPLLCRPRPGRVPEEFKSMARVTVEDCLPLVDNRFALVLLAAKRARQLMAGARPLIETSKNKPPVLSLREVATGRVKFDRDVRETLSGKYDAEAKAGAL